MANLGELIDTGELSFDGRDSSFFLIGLLSAFDNRYQAKADSFFEEISWKQFFQLSVSIFVRRVPLSGNFRKSWEAHTRM